MAITHYIDTSLPEIARSRVKSLTDRVAEQFPVLVYGDSRAHNFIFHSQGTVEPFSGNANYSLNVTLGSPKTVPLSGSYTLTCGSTATLSALSDAVTVEAALNALTTIASEGGVTVLGTFPEFLVTWKTVGSKTAITADAGLLIPISQITITTTQAGSGSAVNQVSLRIAQAVITNASTWSLISTPANGWTGIIPTNTAGALTALQLQGTEAGGLLEYTTMLNVEVLDGTASNIPTCYYQTPITIRGPHS